MRVPTHFAVWLCGMQVSSRCAVFCNLGIIYARVSGGVAIWGPFKLELRSDLDVLVPFTYVFCGVLAIWAAVCI